jgi:hypothetical protein
MLPLVNPEIPMTTYVLLFIYLASGAPLTGDGNTLVFHQRETCRQAGQELLDLTVATATFRFECIRAEESTK